MSGLCYSTKRLTMSGLCYGTKRLTMSGGTRTALWIPASAGMTDEGRGGSTGLP